jgi:cbb3-type cytochrome oxidase subunit 3
LLLISGTLFFIAYSFFLFSRSKHSHEKYAL